MKNILNIAQEAADICAVQRPIDLFSSTSQNDVLFASVVKSALSSLMRHANWQTLTRDVSFETNEGQTAYLIENIASDFQSLVNATMYTNDGARRVIGSLTEEMWAQGKQLCFSDTDIYFKIQNNQIKFLNNPGQSTIHLTYHSNAVCIDAVTNLPKSQMTANTDIPIFDEYLVKLGIVWRFEKRSGLDYAEEYNEYQRELNKSYAATKAAGDICLSRLSESDGEDVIYVKASNCACV